MESSLESMPASETVIKIPIELAREIDKIAGAGKRSAFAIEVLSRELRRTRQKQALAATAGSWKPEQHGGDGASAVEQSRYEDLEP